MKYILPVLFALVSSSAVAQNSQYSQLGALGKVLNFEPIPAAQKAGKAVLNTTPTQAAVGATTAYAGYKALTFAGKHPILAGSALTLATAISNPKLVETYVNKNPQDTEKMFRWLEDQKKSNPESYRQVEQLQAQVLSAAFKTY